MVDPQKGDQGDPPKEEDIDTEQVEWLDPFADGVPILLEGESPDE